MTSSWFIDPNHCQSLELLIKNGFIFNHMADFRKLCTNKAAKQILNWFKFYNHPQWVDLDKMLYVHIILSSPKECHTLFKFKMAFA